MKLFPKARIGAIPNPLWRQAAAVIGLTKSDRVSIH